MEKEKRKRYDRGPAQMDMLPYVLPVIAIAFVVVVVLALLGPTIGNVFSNISRGPLKR